MFATQRPMLSLYQTIADHFYPERADFTITRNVGSEIADLIIDSYPVLARRDLGNSFSAMLRDGHWYDMVAEDTNHMGNMWMEWATQRLMKLQKRRDSNFVRATKEGDHDYAAFGQLVMSIEINKQRNGLLYRAWHLRDCAWFEDETGQVAGVSRKWKPKLHEALQYFGEDKVHPKMLERKMDEPFKDTEFRHLILPAHMYGDDEIESKYPYVSLWLDVANEHMVEEQGLFHKHYAVPRFQTIAGSAYAYSPATIASLPNARLLQAMTHTLLEAGERYARPPLLATMKAIRSDVDLSSDGITWVDDEYDQRTGAALAPLRMDKGGFPYGADMRQGVTEILASTFYLDKLSLPDISRDMTAYEVADRMKQYRRENLPLFAPIESEYNGQLCEQSFQLALQAGLLGSPYDIPKSLQGADVEFKFQSPLTESETEKKANQYQQVSRMLAESVELDPGLRHNINLDVAFRDAVDGTGAPERWLADIEQVAQGRQQDMMQQAAALAMESGAVAEQ